MTDHIDTLGTIVTIDGTTIHGIDLDTIPIPDGDTGDKNTSTLDSGTTMDKGLGMFDPGSAEITGIKVSGDTGQAALVAAYGDRVLHTFQVKVVDAGEVYEYQGYVTKFNPGSADNTYKFSSKILASGAFSLSTTYAGITSIEGAGAGIAYSPANANTELPSTANDVIFKEATGITTDTVKVTAALASYIGISYNNGSTWTTLTSGTATAVPEANWPAAGKLTKALIKVKETGKATRFVNLFIARA